MPTDRLYNLFDNCDENVRTIIWEVLILEMEHISMKSPRVKDDIDAIVSRVAKKVTK